MTVRPGRGARGGAGLAAGLLVGALAAAGCEGRLQQRAEPVAPLPPPDCGAGADALPLGEVVDRAELVPGPTMAGGGIVERFEVRRRDCLLVAEVVQETPVGRVSATVTFDADGRPLTAERRRTATDRPGLEEVERIELRGGRPRLTRRTAGGETEHRVLRGDRPVAVVGPGRGMLGVWIRAAGLEVGDKRRGPVLDLREYVRIREATLRRDPDRDEPTLGRRVQVHTVYGRDSVFTDAHGRVIGDLAGLRARTPSD